MSLHFERRANHPEVVHRARQLIEYMREIVRGSHKPVRDCWKHPEVLWLSGLPDDRLRRHSDGDRMLLKMAHRPLHPALALPEVLVGWVNPEAAATATLEVPPLAEPGPGQGWQEDENGDLFEVSEICGEEAHDVLRQRPALEQGRIPDSEAAAVHDREETGADSARWQLGHEVDPRAC
ncbi:hypothetical protein [Streptomyces californicus]|uniref:hypothetical protein n=1 Tax=Streptomyces TaxID=1883 RepID=UPI0036C6D2BF